MRPVRYYCFDEDTSAGHYGRDERDERGEEHGEEMVANRSRGLGRGNCPVFHLFLSFGLSLNQSFQNDHRCE